jgi:hypothetical protein
LLHFVGHYKLGKAAHPILLSILNERDEDFSDFVPKILFGAMKAALAPQIDHDG